jgi:hypothetical protein
MKVTCPQSLFIVGSTKRWSRIFGDWCVLSVGCYKMISQLREREYAVEANASLYTVGKATSFVSTLDPPLRLQIHYIYHEKERDPYNMSCAKLRGESSWRQWPGGSFLNRWERAKMQRHPSLGCLFWRRQGLHSLISCIHQSSLNTGTVVAM